MIGYLILSYDHYAICRAPRVGIFRNVSINKYRNLSAEKDQEEGDP